MELSEHICVVGAGPIGNHITTELLDRGHKVLVIESGGIDTESDLLNFSDYVFITPSMLPQDVHRVGGGGNHWIGRIGEFLDKDFLDQSEFRIQRWPFAKSELEPYYRAVYSKLIGSDLLDVEFITENFKSSLNIPDGMDIRLIRYTDPHRLRNLFLSYLNHPNLRFFGDTLVTKIDTAIDSILPIVSVRNTFGVTEQILVKKVIVAGGALQSTKLFLNSPSIQNEHNSLYAGHFLMEHLDGYIGDIQVRKGNKRFVDDIALNANRKLISAPDLDCGLSVVIGSIKEEKSENINVGFEIVSQVVDYRFAPSINGSDTRSQSVFRKNAFFVERIVKKLVRSSSNFVKNRVFGVQVYSIWLKAEELPFIDSFVGVDAQTCKVVYTHRVSLETSDAVRKVLAKFETMIETENFGKVRYYNHVMDASKTLLLRPNWHPMGTLRMGEPGNSVVDQNLTVHGEDNVFILSSAVFPTGSNQNPVFTTLALGTRLADYLSENGN